LTHKHLDHSGDINVMIEAMTEGGFKKRGIVFAPKDALDNDPVILQYLRGFPQKIEVLRAKKTYRVGDFTFQASMRHLHPVETYGIKFTLGRMSVGLLVDTRYFKKLSDFYKTDLLVIGVVFLVPRPGVDHLSMVDAEKLIREIKPKRTILTHFGMSMLKVNPHIVAQELSRKVGLEVAAAYDGMTVYF
jgi:phosphoribosyl 1,2-cyclic phosphodiesterase